MLLSVGVNETGKAKLYEKKQTLRFVNMQATELSYPFSFIKQTYFFMISLKLLYSVFIRNTINWIKL